MLEVMADHRCDAPTCSTCDLFLAIPDSRTPEYETWRRSIRTQLLTDRYVLSLSPDLVLWLIDQGGVSDDRIHHAMPPATEPLSSRR